MRTTRRKTKRRAYEDPRYVRSRARLRTYDHVCHHCGYDIDMNLRHPHPLSWSCDHIVPKSMLDEKDDRNWHISNLQAAHLRCNEARGNKQQRRTVRPLDW